MAAEVEYIPSLYLETTVVSYHTSRPSRDGTIRKHQEITHEWWEKELAHYRVFVSARVILEARQGDSDEAESRLLAVSEIDLLVERAEIPSLATLLRRELLLPEKAIGDAFHVAYPISCELDYLLTWNCAHLANPQTQRRLANLTRQHGFWLPIICTPEEIARYSEEI
ncbi:MAG: type II toxin-antitoxin system VapC family toxin [Planctomycetes bacterium]|nr:type II toxin-antitoxin system VapC family toxin [Planctomycetota bacterium]